MKISAFIPAAVLGLVFAPAGQSQTPLPVPGFHHLHLNSTNPDAAIDFYVKNFPSTSKTTWEGIPALKTGNVYVLFNKVSKPAPLMPQTAIWHFGWHVTHEHVELKRFQEMGTKLLPLYTGEGDEFVYVNSDTYPGVGGLGRTKAQLAEAKAQQLKPPGGAGFGYIGGPDGAMIEYQGNMPAERFNHVHMYQDQPFCAQLWYEEHLEAPKPRRGPQHTDADCKVTRGTEKSWPSLTKDGMYRVPGNTGVSFSGVSLIWYMNPGDKPLAPTRGHMEDHIGLSVTDLNAWLAKLEKEHVKILRKPYKLGDTRAFMIEGPSREAIELVEVK